MAKRTLVVDDHPLMAQATQELLERNKQIQVVGLADTGKSCLESAALLKPDIVIIDYNLPDRMGTELVKQLKELLPEAHVIIFNGLDISDDYNYLIEFGVSGIISKESNERQIETMVQCILDGFTMLPVSIYRNMRVVINRPVQQSQLTEEEVHIMQLVIKGATQEKIANEIFVSKRSVDNYLKKIYTKLGVKSRGQAIEQFIKTSIM